MVGKSGKVMQGAVPFSGTGKRELSRTVEESEGHNLSAASLVGLDCALARPKITSTTACANWIVST